MRTGPAAVRGASHPGAIDAASVVLPAIQECPDAFEGQSRRIREDLVADPGQDDELGVRQRREVRGARNCDRVALAVQHEDTLSDAFEVFGHIERQKGSLKVRSVVVFAWRYL